MPRGVEARGSIGTPGVPRALGSLSGGRKKFALQAVPAPVQKFRAMTLGCCEELRETRDTLGVMRGLDPRIHDELPPSARPFNS
jgi:hypothetical protein